MEHPAESKKAAVKYPEVCAQNFMPSLSVIQLYIGTCGSCISDLTPKVFVLATDHSQWSRPSQIQILCSTTINQNHMPVYFSARHMEEFVLKINWHVLDLGLDP